MFSGKTKQEEEKGWWTGAEARGHQYGRHRTVLGLGLTHCRSIRAQHSSVNSCQIATNNTFPWHSIDFRRRFSRFSCTIMNMVSKMKTLSARYAAIIWCREAPFRDFFNHQQPGQMRFLVSLFSINLPCFATFVVSFASCQIANSLTNTKYSRLWFVRQFNPSIPSH